MRSDKIGVALYPLSSPNHNVTHELKNIPVLRYILFHHQTTTSVMRALTLPRCVISSFITKPQLQSMVRPFCTSCVISSFITKPQRLSVMAVSLFVALYPLSSPNHNYPLFRIFSFCVALYPLSSPNHNSYQTIHLLLVVALYPLSSPNHNLYFLCVVI